MTDINLILGLVGLLVLTGFLLSFFKRKKNGPSLKGGFDPEKFKSSLPDCDEQDTLMSLHLEDYGNFTKLRRYIDDLEVYDSEQGRYLPLYAFPRHIQKEITAKLPIDTQASDVGRSNFVKTKDSITSDNTNIRLCAPIDISTAPNDGDSDKKTEPKAKEKDQRDDENLH